LPFWEKYPANTGAGFAAPGQDRGDSGPDRPYAQLEFPEIKVVCPTVMPATSVIAFDGRVFGQQALEDHTRDAASER
jgi:hypothetical protein